jgi:hypothetical protein
VTNDSETFIQEVDEGVRRDRVLSALKIYGPWALGAFAALLVGLGGWLWYKDHRTTEARAQADKFMAVQEQAQSANATGAAAAFEALSKEGPQSYRVMALMERAAALETQGDLDGAIAGFDAAAAAAKDPVLRDTAKLRAAYLVADSQDFAALKARLDPMIAAGGPISYLASELLGVEAWEAGQTDLARSTFENLNLAFDAPDSVRQRVGLALAVLGPAPNPPAAAQPPAAPAAGAAHPTGDAQ